LGLHHRKMADKPKSRWADTQEDAELEAKIKKEKEEKRRKKAEKARKAEEQKQQQRLTVSSQHRGISDAGDETHDSDGRPLKRRRLTPEPGASTRSTNNTASGAAADGSSSESRRLLRFESSGWGKSRSVENYDKLNDIEEGTYGWVARAAERASGKVVALKRLKLEPGDRSGLPVTGLREIQILKDCRHRNVVGMEEVVVGDDLSKLDK
jgi:cell division cycle 2-like protein